MGTHSSRRIAGRRPGRPELAVIEPLPGEVTSAYFDAAFYLETYPDVAGFAGEPREHYLAHGLGELRYPNAAALQADIDLIAASGQFDAETFCGLYGAQADPVREFLVSYRYGPLRPNAAFDGAFVTAYYRRSLRAHENPFLFYCRHRGLPWCYQSMADAKAAADIISRSPLFDANFVRANYLGGREGLSPEVYYLTEGFRLLHDPSSGFSTAAYLYDNPDIVLAQMNPLLHYEMGGRAEHRPASSTAGVRIVEGGMKADPRRRTLLLVSHQASRTGAPILALNLLRRLNTRFNVVTLLLEGGELVDDFRRMSSAVAVSGMRTGEVEAAVQAICRTRQIDCALLNTVVCAHGIEPLVRRGVPILTLIHDFAQYTRPLGLHARTVALSNRVIYPAALVRDAAMTEIEELIGQPVQPANVEVRAQGRCLVPSGTRAAAGSAAEVARTLGRDRPGEPPLAVIGAGHIEPRKGVDLFIEAARVVSRDLGEDCRFAWIGGGYRPDIDANVSVYLQDQVRRSGLEDVVSFVEAQDTLAPWMAAADAFFMSSRLDPYPNVVLDALAHGLPVVCFEGATGAAELAADFPDEIRAASYLRVREAAELLIEMGRRKRPPVSRKLQKRLDFSPYADHVAGVLDQMADGAEGEARLADAMLDDRRLQADSLAATLPTWLGSPLTRSGPTQAHLARLAARLAVGGLPIAAAEPGGLAGNGAGYRSIDPEACGRGRAPDLMAVWAETPAHIRALADHLFQSQAATKVVIASRSLTQADLAPLAAVLPRGAVRLLAEGAGGRAELAGKLAALLPQGAIVHMVRFTDADPSRGQGLLDPAIGGRACAALAEVAGPRLVLARAVQSGPPAILERSGLRIPAHLVDQRQCWLKTDDAALAHALARELTAPAAGTRRERPWGASGRLAGAAWALIEPQAEGGCDFDLTWGRREVEVHG